MEYSTVNGPSCSYVSLANYNGVQRNPQSVGMPYVPATTVSGFYITPNYDTIGYNALTHGDSPSCAGYFNIEGAYGKNAANCNTQYTQRLCNQ
jgi:hypothetical protein